jgi:hypothetical protein
MLYCVKNVFCCPGSRVEEDRPMAIQGSRGVQLGEGSRSGQARPKLKVEMNVSKRPKGVAAFAEVGEEKKIAKIATNDEAI